MSDKDARPRLLTGLELVAAERRRQEEKEGFDAQHDMQYGHAAGSNLCWAAVALLAPEPVYTISRVASGFYMGDPFPSDWDAHYDKRPRNGAQVLANGPHQLTRAQRVRQLVIAAALAIAEIDRLRSTDTQYRGEWPGPDDPNASALEGFPLLGTDGYKRGYFQHLRQPAAPDEKEVPPGE